MRGRNSVTWVGQGLPPGGPEREALREKGQFWTPPWVAEAMVAYVLGGGARTRFDPAVGAGAFFLAARRLFGPRRVELRGTEIDPTALDEALRSGLDRDGLRGVEIRDFVLDPPDGRFPAIVANPPYVRHHRLPPEKKAKLQMLTYDVLGRWLDGRAGLHVYFLIRALQRLADGGRLAFLVPADTVEGVFAPGLWEWIASRYRVEAVVTFAPHATPFPGVDTNPLILMIRAVPPGERITWAYCREWGTPQLTAWVRADFPENGFGDLDVCRRLLKEALATGLSRPPAERQDGRPKLGEYVVVRRGIATGANEFFFMTRKRAAELGIPGEFLHPAIGRTRDVAGEEVTEATLERLEAAGRPNVLFSPDGRPFEEFPPPVQRYLRRGMAMGLPRRPLLATRTPWYKMEVRKPPPFLFAYLGRRNARFIRNRAGVVPLTGFLCVYPRDPSEEAVERLWRVLRHPDTLANLRLVGKSYGGGAIKVERSAFRFLRRLRRISGTSEGVWCQVLDTGAWGCFKTATGKERGSHQGVAGSRRGLRRPGPGTGPHPQPR